MDLNLADFLYDLPEGKIAKYPTKNRADSKLLCYEKGNITHHSFTDITERIPADSLMVFNNTKVIPARVIMHKETGARIEIFLLEPKLPSNVHEEVMNAHHTCTWKCMIGNAKKWQKNTSLIHDSLDLSATRISDSEVTFEWAGKKSFAELLTEIGKIPLPPYLNREVDEEDADRYQTVYATADGAVAAPTAGLHFTEEILSQLASKNVKIDYVTLHVSAGTFQPIKETNIENHPMHNEQILISKQNIKNIIDNEYSIAVGTTAMRTMESLYWFGVKLLNNQSDFFIRKSDAYTLDPIGRNDSLKAVLAYMNEQQLEVLHGQTEIFIYPGYTFRVCNGLVTNYHLPGSTLTLLVAAFIGPDWRKVYKEALAKDYRFLSYGDSSVLLT